MQAAPISDSQKSETRLRWSTQQLMQAAKQNRWQHAVLLLAEMQAQGLGPNVITYSATISACEKGSQWHEALELLAEMQAQGLEPNVITYNAAISACEKGSQWQQALELLAEMQAQGLEPNVISYNAAISARENASCYGFPFKIVLRISILPQRGILRIS